MIIILGVLALLVGGILLAMFTCKFEDVGFVIAILSVVVLVFIGIAFVTQHHSVKSFIIEVGVIQETLDDARAKGIELENAAILKTIAETNARLARIKYYNTTIFKMWVPDAIMEVEPVK